MTETELAESISRTADVKLRYDISQRTKNRYEIEINKKFALAAACLIFVLLGAPLALRFPRGGVGLVLGVSLGVFALYYVGLIGGESLANKGIIPPFWAMWGANVILTIVGVVLLFAHGTRGDSGRGGDWADRWDRVRAVVDPPAAAGAREGGRMSLVRPLDRYVFTEWLKIFVATAVGLPAAARRDRPHRPPADSTSTGTCRAATSR